MNSATTHSRRDFLYRAGLATAAFGTGQLLSPGLFAAPSRPWVTSIRDMHLKLTNEPSCWEALGRLGVSAIESVVDDELKCTGLYQKEKAYSVATRDDCRALADELARRGVTITALAMSNRLDERLEQELEWMRKTVDAAEQLKIRVIRIDVVPRRIPRDQFLPFAIKACRQLCDLIKDRPVVLGIENHGEFTNDPGVLERLFDGVNSDQLGLTLDVMNFYWFGHPLADVYQICEKFAPRVFHTHCKNLSYPADRQNARRPMGWEYEAHAAPLDQGDIDYGKVAAILRQAKYGGDLCLENECLGRFPKDQHVPILKRELALLRTL